MVVRKDLTESQRAVQAGHALAEYMLNSSQWRNSTLIYLGVRGLHQLENLKRKLEYEEIEHYAFYEPDLGNQITAIASDKNSTIFKKLNLL